MGDTLRVLFPGESGAFLFASLFPIQRPIPAVVSKTRSAPEAEKQLISLSSVERTVSPWSLRSRASARWVHRDQNPAAALEIARETGLPPMIARIFAARGFANPGEVQEFIAPALARTHDPFLLKGMEAATDRVLRAIERREPIVVYGDYDVDGITSTAILIHVLKHLSAEVRPYIPHRMSEGYGLGESAIRQLASEGAKLIITVDNGTTAIEEIAVACSLGVDVIVTDHHEPGAELPPAFALINPKQAGCEYPFKELCGAGIAFKFAHALLRRAGADPEVSRTFLRSLLDFVALGTVADVVPLRGENRCFVTHGMQTLRTGGRLGIQCLYEVMGLGVAEIQADRIAYTIAPRLNAAGRTEHAEYALDLLLSDDPKEARELAGLLERFNEDRRRIEQEMTEDAFGLIDEDEDAPVIVVGREGWHHGVVGIVASRLLERYYRPVIVLGIDGDTAKGSARSIRGFDVHAALESCRDHLDQFGGHTMAAGLRLRADGVDGFRSAIQDYAREKLAPEDLVPKFTIDTLAGPEELTAENIRALEGMSPFGPGNPKPLLEIDGLNLVEEPRALKGKHLKLHLAGPGGTSIWAIGFSLGDRIESLRRRHRQLRLVATPVINNWGGRSRVELEIKDFMVED